MEITGGCLCKAVRFRITAAAHCDAPVLVPAVPVPGAGNATVNVVFPSNAVSIEGELRDYRSVADSGNVMHRRFCPTCGTHLFSESESRPHLIIVRNGALDDTELLGPTPRSGPPRRPSGRGSTRAFRNMPGSRRPIPA